MDDKDLFEMQMKLRVMHREGRSEVNYEVTALLALIHEIQELREGFKEAVQIIKEGKHKFSPETTNSHVDYFLKKWD